MRMRNYEWFLLSKVKKLAEEFLAKYPTMFSSDFEANKKALDQIAVIRNRALRNQIAGAISAMASELSSEKESKAPETQFGSTVEDRLDSTKGAIPQQQTQ